MTALLVHLALMGALPADVPLADAGTREASDEERLEGRAQQPLPPPPPPPAHDATDEDRVDENTPPPPEVRWPPKSTERLEEPEPEPDTEGPSAAALLESDHTIARSSLIGGDALVGITFAVGFAFAVDGDASLKVAAVGGALAGLIGPGIVAALAFDRSIATAWFDWFGWLGGALTAGALLINSSTPVPIALALTAVTGLVCHLGLVLTPDREGVHGLEFLLLGAGLTLATVFFAATASGLGNPSDGFADLLPRAAMILPGLVIAATRVGFAARNDWGSPPVVTKVSFWAAPERGGASAGIGLVW